MNIKNKKDNKKFIMTILAISIIAVMFVPMLYSSIYLGSIWNAYGRIDKVPVAFVNMDKLFTKDGKEYHIGKELENNLKDNNKVNWKLVDYEEAKKGLEGTDYYAVIEIPEDFSKKVANAQNGEFDNPEIIYMANKGKNFIFSQISEKVANSIKSEVSSNIQKEISKALVNSLYDVKVSIKDAGDGAGKLQDGTQKLLNGSNKLTNGAQKAASGSIQLESGLNEAANASTKLQDGTQKLFNGSSDLSKGLNLAAGGSKQLEAGLKSLVDGENQLVDGSTLLVNGLNDFKSGLTKTNNQIPLLVKGASDLNNNTILIEQGAQKLNNSLNTNLNSLADGVKETSDGINQASSILNAQLDNINNSNLSQDDKDKLKAAILAVDKVNKSNISANIEAPMRKLGDSAQPLVGSIIQLEEGTKQVSEGVSLLANGLSDNQSKAEAVLDQLINGAKGIQNGSSSILAGLNIIAGKTGELGYGLDKLNSGSATLKDGLQVVNDGNIKLKEGLNTAVIKTGELSDGLKQLSDGSTSLNSGLNDANDGVTKLSNGLNNGYGKISDNLKFNSEDMSKFVSEPVSLKNNTINDVKYYGEGFGPYFISLSLWIGIMLLNIIISIEKPLNIFKNKFVNSFIGRFVIGSGIVTLQALILSFVLIKWLGINPVNITSFYISNIFIAIVFFSVMYGVSHAIGVLGAPIMFIVLLLQLASSGGTFPIETAPVFYQAVGKIIPMTYSVNTLRMIISGINSSLLSHNIVILITFMIVSLIGGALIRLVIDKMKNKEEVIDNSQVI